ncbi:MAG: hypothetical protein ABI207_02980 [Crocinitomicaceae bacterium]
MSKIFIVGIFLCAFSLNSQVIYENKQLILETKILEADDGFLLSIINKTDSILIISSRTPLYRLVDSIYFIDITLINLNYGAATLLEPHRTDITSLKNIFPAERYDFFIRIDSLHLNFKQVKYWYFDLQYITYPINQKLDYGYFNFEFRKFLYLYKIPLNELSFELINNNIGLIPSNLKLKNVGYYVRQIEAPITEPPPKKRYKKRNKNW